MAGLRWRHSSELQGVEIVSIAGEQALSRSRPLFVAIDAMHQVSKTMVEVLMRTCKKAAKVFEVTRAVAVLCAPTHSIFIGIFICPFSVP
ncbi:MAG: hypothetical protein ACI83N_000384 [Hydrogenophaga sp.]|jgi:hypothetical protein